MLRITVKAQTSATPEQVLAIAGTDFSAARATVWPNVTTRKLDVHERGANFAEVTEGATGRPIWEIVAEYLRSKEVLSAPRLNSPQLSGVGGNPGIA